MSLTLAGFVATWIALIVLLLATSRLYYDVKILQRQQQRHGSASPPVASVRPTEIPELRGHIRPGGAIVAAVDGQCSTCWEVVEGLIEAPTALQRVLLTFDEEAWKHEARVTLVVSERAWSRVSHIQPPLLMLVDSSGRIEQLELPVSANQASSIASRWDSISQGSQNASV